MVEWDSESSMVIFPKIALQEKERKARKVIQREVKEDGFDKKEKRGFLFFMLWWG
jgi:hypothetical protein